MKISNVTLCTRPVKGGQLVLYLRYKPAIRCPETMKFVHSESLCIYIWEHPENSAQRQHNEDILIKAEGIRSQRVQALINEEYGFLDHHKRDADFLEFFRKYAWKSSWKGQMAYRHFEKWCGGKCRFGELTVELGNNYMDYLTTKARKMRPDYGRLSTNTASTYFNTFKGALRKAYNMKMIRENLADYLGSIPLAETHKEYLTLDEVKQLAATPCKHEVLKRAALFLCLTGLRISDK